MAKIKYLTIPKLTAKDIQRFFSKVKIDNNTGCWVWTASTNNGYGQFGFKGAIHRVHRFTYAWLIAPLPMGHGRDILQLDHVVCDNRLCCNPWHTKLVLLKDNVLRGTGISAINARKTHCSNGHILPLKPLGKQRTCRICQREWNRIYKIKNRDKILHYSRKRYQEHKEKWRERYLRFRDLSSDLL